MGKRTGASGGKRQAIRAAFGRLGLHTSPSAVVRELAGRGIRVSEDLVRAVRIELLNEVASVHHRPAVRRRSEQPYRPQKRPPRRG